MTPPVDPPSSASLGSLPQRITQVPSQIRVSLFYLAFLIIGLFLGGIFGFLAGYVLAVILR